jgi:hypothetical protein
MRQKWPSPLCPVRLRVANRLDARAGLNWVRGITFTVTELLMKTLALALLGVALLATPALAQTEGTAPAATPAAAVTSRCGDVPASPTVPDGATSNRRTMNAASEAFNAWGPQAQAIQTCRRAEAEEARQRADALAAQFNANNSELRRVSDLMVAEMAEFNAR